VSEAEAAPVAVAEDATTGAPPATLDRAKALSGLAILPLRDTVVFPDSLAPLAIGQPRSIKLVDDAVEGDQSIALVAGKVAEGEATTAADVYDVGVVASIQKLVRVPDGTMRVLVQASERIKLAELVRTDPYLVGRFEPAPDVNVGGDEVEALARSVEALFTKIIGLLPYLPDELRVALASIDEPGSLANMIGATLRLAAEERQELLAEVDVEARLRKLTVVLSRELEMFELGSKIQAEVQESMGSSQREYFLRQQLKAIQEELGEGDEQQAEVAELRARLEEVELPEQAAKQARRELDRLARLPAASPEYGVIRTYLEWIIELPWSTTTEDNLDLHHAQEVLDDDHYDLEKVKERIIEFLAVSKLTGSVAGQILCLVGPPGVGKTSLGQSVARALGREFIRISVGGVRDEAEIRGHRRTYVGALPGTVIRALRDAGSANPVFMIDEIDKMGSDFRGDPSSAMLEVLDPAQHSTYRDHYLDLPFDLSRVLFICTANQLEPIPGPLRDRMEMIQLAGYTEDEKLGIAKRYLVPRQLEAHGLEAGGLSFTDKAIRTTIRDYTREAGVRNLERQLAAVARKVARSVAEGKKARVRAGEAFVRDALGRAPFRSEPRKRANVPGVATGLAWTPVGGDVLFVEATAMPGRGRLTVTGQVGDVMRESAQAAVSWARSRGAELGLVDPEWFEEQDIHIHVPAGAVPKDGPSAGITMAAAVASLASKRKVERDTAMTGELTLTGLVLPVGGIKEKVLAAQRAGVKRVVLPSENQGDLDDLPDDVRASLSFVLVERVGEAVDAVLTRPRR
jgi:ATP-dependent Lon protease